MNDKAKKFVIEDVKANDGETFAAFRDRMIEDARANNWGIVSYSINDGASTDTIAPDVKLPPGADAEAFPSMICRRRRRV